MSEFRYFSLSVDCRRRVAADLLFRSHRSCPSSKLRYFSAPTCRRHSIPSELTRRDQWSHPITIIFLIVARASRKRTRSKFARNRATSHLPIPPLVFTQYRPVSDLLCTTSRNPPFFTERVCCFTADALLDNTVARDNGVDRRQSPADQPGSKRDRRVVPCCCRRQRCPIHPRNPCDRERSLGCIWCRSCTGRKL